MTDGFRKFAPCFACVNLHHDERDKEIHGLGLCGKHYKQHLRRRQRADGDGSNVIITDRHVTQELRAHEFLAERFQKFLHVLNTEHVTLITTPEQRTEVRLLLNPILVRSQRVAVPRSLPAEMLIDPELGDTSPESSEGTVPSEQLGALAMAREARKKELSETLLHQRAQHSLAFEIISAGYNELSREKYHSGDRLRKLTLAVQLLRSFLSQRPVSSDPGREQQDEEMEP